MADNLTPLYEDQIADKYKGIKGWLSLFVFTLIFVRPVAALLGFASFNQRYDDFFRELPHLQTIANVTLLINLLISSVGIYVGYCLVKLRPKAVSFAKAFLIGLAIVGTILNFVVFSNLPDREQLGGGLLANLASGIGYSVIWYIYLNNSKRVESTFPDQKAEETAMS